MLGVNLKGVYLCARAAIPRMRALGGGSIVNMASVNGFWVEPALGAYCAAKGGVINLTRSIALENGRYGIRCNCICPGYIDTGMAQRYFEIQDDPAAARVEAGRMHALGRIGRPEEIAAMALFLCSDESGFCTAAPFVVDGGLSAGVPAARSYGELGGELAQQPLGERRPAHLLARLGDRDVLEMAAARVHRAGVSQPELEVHRARPPARCRARRSCARTRPGRRAPRCRGRAAAR